MPSEWREYKKSEEPIIGTVQGASRKGDHCADGTHQIATGSAKTTMKTEIRDHWALHSHTRDRDTSRSSFTSSHGPHRSTPSNFPFPHSVRPNTQIALTQARTKVGKYVIRGDYFGSMCLGRASLYRSCSSGLPEDSASGLPHLISSFMSQRKLLHLSF